MLLLPTRFFYFSAVCLGTLLVFSGCNYRPGRGPSPIDGSRDAAPAWYTNPPLDTRLVNAVGAVPGHNREAAVAEAHKDLARQLHITIDGNGDDVDDSQLAPGDQRPATLHVKSLDLPGVKVIHLVHTSDATYVMLAFDRDEWATSLRGRIAAIDERIKEAQTYPPASHNALAGAAQRYQTLRPLVLERDDLYARLLIAEPVTAIPPGRLTQSRLRNEFAAACSGHVADLSIGTYLDPVEKDLAGALARCGFRVKPGASDASLRIDLAMNLDQRTVDGVDRAQGSFNVSVRRGADNLLLGSMTVESRASSPSATIARDRLLQKLVEKWQDYLEDGFVDCLTRF